MKVILNLRKLRQKEKLTQRELALKLNVKQSVISDYERGIMIPSLERAIQLAIILNVTLDEFISYEKAHDAFTENMLKLKNK